MVFAKLSKFYGECRRVLRVTRKPRSDEFQTLVKVTGLGLIVIGAVGFLLTLAKQLLLPAIAGLL